MARLIEKSPCDGLLPLTQGGLRLEELPQATITSVAPFAGQAAKVAAALKRQGLGWPAPNSCLCDGGRAILWTGRDQAFLLDGDPAGLDGLAALTDQSDGWARMRLSGAQAAAVLARHVPLDLSAVAPGWAARTSVGHMMAILSCTVAGSFDIMVFRSMAATAVHELHQAMKAIAARVAV